MYPFNIMLFKSYPELTESAARIDTPSARLIDTATMEPLSESCLMLSSDIIVAVFKSQRYVAQENRGSKTSVNVKIRDLIEPH